MKPQPNDRLIRAMAKQGMTQTDLAGHIGVTPCMVSHYCKGRRLPNLVTATCIAEALDTTVDFLWPAKLAQQTLNYSRADHKQYA